MYPSATGVDEAANPHPAKLYPVFAIDPTVARVMAVEDVV